MSLKTVALRVRTNDVFYLKGMKNYRETYDIIINKLINECTHVINEVDDDITNTLQVFTIKMSDETKTRLDVIAKERRMTRSEVFRRLIQAKAEKLC
jgi:hypothetical protein